MRIQKRERQVIGLLLASSLSTPTVLLAEGFWLVDPEIQLKAQLETEQTKGFGFDKNEPGAPVITLKTPDLNGAKIHSPMTIEVSFTAEDGATIDIDTLEIRYKRGFININITDRILEHATLSETGLVANNAELNAGKHGVIIKVKDNQGRSGSELYKFQISD